MWLKSHSWIVTEPGVRRAFIQLSCKWDSYFWYISIFVVSLEPAFGTNAWIMVPTIKRGKFLYWFLFLLFSLFFLPDCLALCYEFWIHTSACVLCLLLAFDISLEPVSCQLLFSGLGPMLYLSTHSFRRTYLLCHYLPWADARNWLRVLKRKFVLWLTSRGYREEGVRYFNTSWLWEKIARVLEQMPSCRLFLISEAGYAMKSSIA